MHMTDFQDALKHLPFVLATGTQIQMSGQRILEAVLIAGIAALGSGYVTSKQLETQFTEFKTAALEERKRVSGEVAELKQQTRELRDIVIELRAAQMRKP